MTDNFTIQPQGEHSFRQDVFKEAKEAFKLFKCEYTDAEKRSEEKYKVNCERIEADPNMTIQEKQDAGNKNYNSRNQEHLRNRLRFCGDVLVFGGACCIACYVAKKLAVV